LHAEGLLLPHGQVEHLMHLHVADFDVDRRIAVGDLGKGDVELI